MRKSTFTLLVLAGPALGACGGGVNATNDGRVTRGAPVVGAGFGDSTVAGGNVGTGAMGPGGAAGGAAAAVGGGPLSRGSGLNLGRPAWR
jgi:hypothetical protein